MPTHVLPSRPSLDQLKRQARELRLSYLDGDEASRALVKPYRSLLAAEPDGLTLTDAKLVLSRGYGFESWPKLKHHVESLRANYAEMGDFMDLVRDRDSDRAKFIADHYFALPALRSGIQIDVHAAARLDLLERMMTLIEEDPARANQRDEAGLTPLHVAGTDRIRCALVYQYGADPAALDERYGATPAQWAAMDHRPAVAGTLLGEEGVHADIVMLCALDMYDEVKASLQDAPGFRQGLDLEHIPGGKVYARALGMRTTLLHAAVHFGSERVMRLLLDEGADLEATDYVFGGLGILIEASRSGEGEFGFDDPANWDSEKVDEAQQFISAGVEIFAELSAGDPTKALLDGFSGLLDGLE